MNKQAQDLVRRCESIHSGGGEAIGWIQDIRANSPRLDRESDSLIGKIRRVRNLTRRLGRAAARPLSVGFFGLSQAGKSYLVSALAAGKNGELETLLDGERLNFIAHVNPPGHGKEATGLAPYLDPRDRASLFAILRGEIRELTESPLPSACTAPMCYRPIAGISRSTNPGTPSVLPTCLNCRLTDRATPRGHKSRAHPLTPLAAVFGFVRAAPATVRTSTECGR